MPANTRQSTPCTRLTLFFCVAFEGSKVNVFSHATEKHAYSILQAIEVWIQTIVDNPRIVVGIHFDDDTTEPEGGQVH